MQYAYTRLRYLLTSATVSGKQSNSMGGVVMVGRPPYKGRCWISRGYRKGREFIASHAAAYGVSWRKQIGLRRGMCTGFHCGPPLPAGGGTVQCTRGIFLMSGEKCEDNECIRCFTYVRNTIRPSGDHLHHMNGGPGTAHVPEGRNRPSTELPLDSPEPETTYIRGWAGPHVGTSHVKQPLSESDSRPS